ncbi:hypothetical protein K432DRAFT_384393 [Lepidopterella palustris CBS 459.81]|uniref:Uncharacterized protein n=1 Tax=Lepidopterella palustris CBS 459.81 TaxID=1314670 RepID=A0A8E2E5J9_9PEZI|nr:hypothetical protein K432DRAFT_384393 [Lepidopterella palustris CBS 459.81]
MSAHPDSWHQERVLSSCPSAANPIRHRPYNVDNEDSTSPPSARSGRYQVLIWL